MVASPEICRLQTVASPEADLLRTQPSMRMGDRPIRLRVAAVAALWCVLGGPSGAEAASRERQHGFAASGGERIYYESAGRGDAVVLCHGAGGNHLVWFQQVPAFAPSYQVITWDQRGFGRSTNHADMAGPPAAVTDLRRVLARVGVTKVHLVAQSMGGWTALGFALAHPEQVRSLVLSGTTAGIDTPGVRKALEVYLAELAQAPDPHELPLGQHPALLDEFVRRDPTRAFLYQEISLLNEGSAGGLSQKKTWYGRAALAAVRVPVLFVVGSDDRIFRPAVIREAATALPQAEVVEIPHAGHSPYYEQPEEWNRVVLDFVRRATASTESK